jgi:putative membrane protein insertion efficiency factor
MPMRIKTRPLVAALLLCLVVTLPLGYDLSRPPARQVVTRAAVSAIRLYQRTLSGRLGAKCRFTPTCSNYALAVVQKHGAVRGGWLAARRVIRCGPWTAMGTADPPD